jgi:hypothetical protein
MTDRELTDRLTAAIADAEADPNAEPNWVRHREPSRTPTAVYSVRIPVDRIEELRALAAARGIPPTTLIRRWVLAQLDAARDANDYAQRWERDVRATAAQLQKLLDERPERTIADVS